VSADIELPAAAARPAWLSQATAVEQSRAVAEVQAAIFVARSFPRDIDKSRRELDMTCGLMGLAEKAFYKLPRGKDDVTGPTVHLAREVARCWTNVQHGVSELHRDDEEHRSEVLAFGWDIENNLRAAHTFIVPHKRDRSGRAATLVTDMQGIYEVIANAGARRVREQIFAVIPVWFVEQAKSRCWTTLEKGGGVKLPERIDKAVDAFGRTYGLKPEQLERRLGRGRRDWTPYDVAQLTVIFESLRRGELRVDVEFGEEPVTAAELAAPAPAPAVETPPPDADPPAGWGDAPPPETPSGTAPEWPEAAKPGSKA
jgi:hypothetical protein